MVYRDVLGFGKWEDRGTVVYDYMYIHIYRGFIRGPTMYGNSHMNCCTDAE